MLTAQYNDRLTDVLHAAKRTARDLRHANYSAAHLLYVLMEKKTGLPAMLEYWGKDHDYISDWAEMRLENHPRADHPVDFPIGDQSSDRVFEEAEKVRLRLGMDQLEPICLFVALVTPGIAWSLPQLKTLPLSDQEAMALLSERETAISHDPQTREPILPGDPLQEPRSQKIPYVTEVSDSFVTKGRLVIGREGEIRTMQEALQRHHNTGILIIGDSGVGKSALLQGFVHYYNLASEAEGTEAKILQLDVAKLITGCAHNGEIENRLSKTLDKVRKLANPVLLMDDLHILLEDKGGGNNVAYTLSAALSKGGIAIVATTITESFTKKIESNEALVRKLEIIRIQEPDHATSLKCLKVHRIILEKHHDLRISDDTLEEAVKLAKRYFKERKLPDSAINLLDRTLSATVQANQRSKAECESLLEELEQLEREATAEPESQEVLREARWMDSQIQSRLSPVLLGQMTNETNTDNLKRVDEYLLYLRASLEELQALSLQKTQLISSVEVAAMVAHHTGIPLGKIQAKEKDKILKLDNHLRKRVVGQDQAISALSDAILEARSGLGTQGKPIGSFFFLGPTGTGKTELAKTLAEFLFNDEQSMIRFDMSEFKEEHSAALLYGAPPGYVGYEEGGLLVNQIRKQPYSIVLFDEIEKAHPSVYDIFLQIMDEGHIHDRLGKKGSFVDSIVIFTSNLGSEWIAQQFRAGKIPTSSQLTEIMANNFRPEFLGRLTEVVPFGPISEQVVGKIFDIQMRKLNVLIEGLGIDLEVTDRARSYFSKSGYSDRYGARPIASVIRNKIRRPISRMLVRGDIGKGTKVLLDIDEQMNAVWSTPQETPSKDPKEGQGNTGVGQANADPNNPAKEQETISGDQP